MIKGINSGRAWKFALVVVGLLLSALMITGITSCSPRVLATKCEKVVCPVRCKVVCTTLSEADKKAVEVCYFERGCFVGLAAWMGYILGVCEGGK